MVVDIDIEAIQREWAAVTMDTVVTMARPIIAARHGGIRTVQVAMGGLRPGPAHTK